MKLCWNSAWVAWTCKLSHLHYPTHELSQIHILATLMMVLSHAVLAHPHLHCDCHYLGVLRFTEDTAAGVWHVQRTLQTRKTWQLDTHLQQANPQWVHGQGVILWHQHQCHQQLHCQPLISMTLEVRDIKLWVPHWQLHSRHSHPFHLRWTTRLWRCARLKHHWNFILLMCARWRHPWRFTLQRFVTWRSQLSSLWWRSARQTETKFVTADICKCKYSIQFEMALVCRTISSEACMPQSLAIDILC